MTLCHIKYRHTWNIVKIGKTYYHLDATFDNSLGKCFETGAEIRYDYFNLDDKAIFAGQIAASPVEGEGPVFLRSLQGTFVDFLLLG